MVSSIQCPAFHVNQSAAVAGDLSLSQELELVHAAPHHNRGVGLFLRGFGSIEGRCRADHQQEL